MNPPKIQYFTNIAIFNSREPTYKLGDSEVKEIKVITQIMWVKKILLHKMNS